METMCAQCKTIYPATSEHFYRKGNGLNLSWCRKCYNIVGKKHRDKWRFSHPDLVRSIKKKYRLANAGKVRLAEMRYRIEHRQETRLRVNGYYQNHKKERSEYHKKYFETNRNECLEYSKTYRMSHKMERAKYSREYDQKHKNERNKRLANRRAKDLGYKIMCNLRSRLGSSLRNHNASKSDRTTKLIGCTVGELIHFLEQRFSCGMSWANYGRNGWHIDHKIPCAAFDLTRAEDQQRCFNYKNLQPLWANDNWSKSSLYNGKRIRQRRLQCHH